MSLKYTGQGSLTQIFSLIKSKFDGLSKVASSGSYKDLSDKPTIPVMPSLTFQVGSVQISSDSVTAVNIPTNITSTTNLMVYHNGLLLTEGTNYNKGNGSVALIGYTASLDDVFTFISISM